MPMGLLAEAVHHRQPQANALAGRLGAEEGFEGVLQRALRHALAAVGDSQAHIVASAQSAVRSLLGGDVMIVRLDA